MALAKPEIVRRIYDRKGSIARFQSNVHMARARVAGINNGDVPSYYAFTPLVFADSFAWCSFARETLQKREKDRSPFRLRPRRLSPLAGTPIGRNSWGNRQRANKAGALRTATFERPKGKAAELAAGYGAGESLDKVPPRSRTPVSRAAVGRRARRRAVAAPCCNRAARLKYKTPEIAADVA
jgi:hypothetical protein